MLLKMCVVDAHNHASLVTAATNNEMTTACRFAQHDGGQEINRLKHYCFQWAFEADPIKIGEDAKVGEIQYKGSDSARAKTAANDLSLSRALSLSSTTTGVHAAHVAPKTCDCRPPQAPFQCTVAFAVAFALAKWYLNPR